MEFPEAILFDLDGVLLDTEPLLANAWSETAKEYNHYLSNDKLLELKGRRRIDCAKKVLKWINIESPIEELLITQKLKVDKVLTKAKPFKGAIESVSYTHLTLPTILLV